MNSAIDINNFNINYIYFYKVVPNSIIEEGFFNSLFYSTDKYSTTGINIYCLLYDLCYHKHMGTNIQTPIKENGVLIQKPWHIDSTSL